MVLLMRVNVKRRVGGPFEVCTGPTSNRGTHYQTASADRENAAG